MARTSVRKPEQTKTVDKKRSLAAKKAAVTRARNRELALRRQVRLHHKVLAGGAVLVVLVFTFLGIRGELQTYAATANVGSIVGLGNKCLDNSGARLTNGNRVQLYKCNGTTAQKWVLGSDGSLKANNGSAYCLDVTNGKKAEYIYLQLYKCNSTTAQKFSFSGKYLVSKLTGFCATVRYAETANNTRIWEKGCHGTQAQFWRYSGSSTSTGSGGSTTTPPATSPTPPSTPSAPSTGSATYDLSALAKSAGAKAFSLSTGTYQFRNFNDNAGLILQNSGGMAGAGLTKTTVQMAPNSSTRASSVPGQSSNYSIATAKTNSLYLIKLIGGAPSLSNLWIYGTNQGHLYNGLKVDHTNGARISDIKVSAIPGNSDVPPGETFSISDASATNSVYRNVEIDGKNVGASLFAANGASNVTVTDSYFHDAPYGNGSAFWQTSGTSTITNTRSNNNKDFGFNFERQSGSVTITKSTTCGNKQGDYRMGSDWGSATFRIVDPIYCGSKLKIKIPANFNGVSDKQKKSDIKVIINGVDKTNDVVQWIL